MPRSLYLHVPFCPKICPYCDFHKMRRNEGLVAAYLERLEQEASDLHAEFPDLGESPSALKTIYFGGGTPSHLSDEELRAVTRIFEKTWGWPATEETTLEADPLTFDKARLETFRAMGFSRLSIGLQSTQDQVLAFLGRMHDGREGLRAVEMALEAGFEVSADLITAVTGQDAAKDLRALARTGVPHVSVYTLTIEPYTPFARRGVSVDPDKEADDYGLATEILARYGLLRYEVSSHARPGHESGHNQVYWHGDYFLALGPSAAGFVPVGTPPPNRVHGVGRQALGKGDLFPTAKDAELSTTAQKAPIGERRTNPPIKAWLQGEPPEVLAVDAPSYVEDMLMTGLRTRCGVDVRATLARSGIDIFERYGELIRRFEDEGWLERDPTHLRVTPAGMMRLNGIVQAFFNYTPRNRSQGPATPQTWPLTPDS